MTETTEQPELRSEPGLEPGPEPGQEPGQEPGMAQLLEDWVTIWHSELAALASDREVQEAVQRLIDGWAAQARIAARVTGAALDAARLAGAVPPAGAAPTAAAPDARDAVIAQLLARVAELERRLGKLEPP